jgi:excinuclease ABC subunit C
MWDADGELIYVGKAKRLKTRLLTYFRARDDGDKAHRILSRARTIGWEQTPDEFGALVRELELIRRWRPRFNVQGQPGRASRGFICLGRSPAPYFYLAATPSRRTLATFGPVRMGGKSREAVRRLNDLFRLRDCTNERTMAFADQRELFSVEREGPCLRYEIGTCLAPCIGACTRRQYSARARSAKDFLSGKDVRLLDRLRGEMQSASFNQQFELAAHLRDTCELLEGLISNLERLKHVRAEYFFVYPVATHDANEAWYLIRGGNVIQCIQAPVCNHSATQAGRAIERVYAGKENLGPVADDYSETLLTAAWFRRHPGEIEQVLSPTEALHRCETAADQHRAADMREIVV